MMNNNTTGIINHDCLDLWNSVEMPSLVMMYTTAPQPEYMSRSQADVIIWCSLKAS